MYEETKLSEQAQKIEEALITVPPKYDEADEIFVKYSITKEELAKVAYDLMDECLDEQLIYWDSLEELVEDNTVCSNIYKIMQHLFSKGFDPNIVVDGDCAMNFIPFLDYPEGLAPRLMRLFMESGGDPNLVIDRVSLFVQIDSAVSFDMHKRRSFVYCWLVLMAYGGRRGEDKYPPLTMQGDLDVSIFKRFEDYAYYKIVPGNQVPGKPVSWEMLIYDTSTGETPKLVASYGGLNVELADMTQNGSPCVEQHDKETDNSKTDSTKNPGLDSVPISEDKFLRKIAKMYRENTSEDIRCHMESGFRYSSFYVYTEMTSADEYVDYITAKVQALKNHNIVIRTRMMHFWSGKPCLVITQEPKDPNMPDMEPGCLFVKRSENGLIARMDIMPISFYKLIP